MRIICTSCKEVVKEDIFKHWSSKHPDKLKQLTRVRKETKDVRN